MIEALLTVAKFPFEQLKRRKHMLEGCGILVGSIEMRKRSEEAMKGFVSSVVRFSHPDDH